MFDLIVKEGDCFSLLHYPIATIQIGLPFIEIIQGLVLQGQYDRRTTMQVIKEGLHRYVMRNRPWMYGIIPYRETVSISAETDNQILDIILRDTMLNIEQTFLKHPSRLISIRANVATVDISILCDVRVYLWTKDQEDKLCHYQ